MQIGLIYSTGCPLKRNIRHNRKTMNKYKSEVAHKSVPFAKRGTDLFFCRCVLYGELSLKIVIFGI